MVTTTIQTQYITVFYIGFNIYFTLFNIIFGPNDDSNYTYENLFRIVKIVSLLFIVIHQCHGVHRYIGHLWIISVSLTMLIYFSIHIISLSFFIEPSSSGFTYIIWEFINNIYFCTFSVAFYFRQVLKMPEFPDDLNIAFPIESIIFYLLSNLVLSIFNSLKQQKNPNKNGCCTCLQPIKKLDGDHFLVIDKNTTGLISV